MAFRVIWLKIVKLEVRLKHFDHFSITISFKKRVIKKADKKGCHYVNIFFADVLK